MELALWDQMSSQEQQESSRTAFRYAQYAVLARLAGIKTDQSARLLVDILKDKSVRYDGEAAEARYDIILQCGKPCLPYLEQIEDKDPCKGEARDLIKGIKEANP
jgi:HEAT repeat protein